MSEPTKDGVAANKVERPCPNPAPHEPHEWHFIRWCPSIPVIEKPYVPDLDRSFVTVMVPTAPRTTASSSPADPTHVPTVVSLRQLAAWLKEGDPDA